MGNFTNSIYHSVGKESLYHLLQAYTIQFVSGFASIGNKCLYPLCEGINLILQTHTAALKFKSSTLNQFVLLAKVKW
jgi:hypothetical protein